MYEGIDVSRWQGNIDFEKVKASGIDFVIIKAGGSDKGFYKDPKFEENYTKAKAAGLKVGAYYFVGRKFYGDISGIADAHRFINILGDKQFEYPVFVDIETTDPIYKDFATDAAISFCEEIEKAGYFVGIYASDVSGFKDRLELDRVKRFLPWVARYGNEPSYNDEWQIWQYSSKGNIPGVSSNVDLDRSKTDISKVIIEKGFNNFKKAETPKRAATKRRKKE